MKISGLVSINMALVSPIASPTLHKHGDNQHTLKDGGYSKNENGISSPRGGNNQPYRIALTHDTGKQVEFIPALHKLGDNQHTPRERGFDKNENVKPNHQRGTGHTYRIAKLKRDYPTKKWERAFPFPETKLCTVVHSSSERKWVRAYPVSPADCISIQKAYLSQAGNKLKKPLLQTAGLIPAALCRGGVLSCRESVFPAAVSGTFAPPRRHVIIRPRRQRRHPQPAAKETGCHYKPAACRVAFSEAHPTDTRKNRPEIALDSIGRGGLDRLHLPRPKPHYGHLWRYSRKLTGHLE